MKKGKVLLFDGFLALLIIVGLSSCDKNFNPQKFVAKSGDKVVTIASQCCVK